MPGSARLALFLAVSLAAAAMTLGGCGREAPALDSITPASQSAGGRVTLAGSGFGDNRGEGMVKVGEEPAAVESWSAASIVILVPSGLEPGVYQVSVTTSGGTSGPLPLQVAPASLPSPPHVSSLQPTTGPSGTLVTIYGSGFGASQGGGRVNAGTVQMAASSWSDGKIEASVPAALEIGQYQISVTTSGGTSNPVVFMVTAQVDDRQLQEQAVQQDMTARGVDPGGWVLKRVEVSAGDPAWALLDYQRSEGAARAMYLLREAGGTWSVVASGGDDFNPQAHGAPADLKPF